MSPKDIHLDLEQIEFLLSAEVPGTSGGDGENELQNMARRHIETCASCRSSLSIHRELKRKLFLLKENVPVDASSDCLPGRTFRELSAGLIEGSVAEELLDHVASCDSCALLLRMTTEEFNGETNIEELDFLDRLKSSSPEWQAKLARRLGKAALFTKRELLPRNPKFWRFAAAFACALALAIAVTWFGFGLRIRLSPDELVSRAYSERRSVEMRMVGVDYSPLRQYRGKTENQLRSNLPALLRAESEIAEALRARPDDPAWLQARGRTSLLEGDPEGAISNLERAVEQGAKNSSLQIDLASAYFDRGTRLGRPRDVGKAVDILGRVLSTQPENQVAIFNYAIALEEIPLNEQARAEWRRFIALFPQSSWIGEANERLSKLEEKIQQQEKKSGVALESSAVVAALAKAGADGNTSLLDSRIERYLETAIKEWLPVAFNHHGAKLQSEPALEATKEIARLLIERHGDPWLDNLVVASARSEDAREGLILIAQTQQYIEVSDENSALKASKKAFSIFARSHNTAGEIFAQFQTIYAHQLTHKNKECSFEARRLERRPELARFAWLQIQVGLESAICASTSDDRAVKAASASLAIATKHGYVELRSRAIKTLSGIQWAVGNSESSWVLATQGLRDYWISSIPPLRGYSLLTDLDFLAEDGDQPFLQVAVLKEAIQMIQNDPDGVMKAFEFGRLARALIRTGDLKGSELALTEMTHLFTATPIGDRSRNLRAEAEIGFAEVDLERGLPRSASARLGKLQRLVERLGDDDLALEFFKIYGVALAAEGDQDTAEVMLASALKLANDGLPLIHEEVERLRWARRNEPLYRAIVSSKIETRPFAGLAYWESYKDFSLTDNSPQRGLQPPRDPVQKLRTALESIGSNGVLVSYFFTSTRLAILVADATRTQITFAEKPRQDIEALARRFSAHCSDPASNLEIVQQEGAELYKELFSPIDSLLRGRHTLILEPDGDLKQIPFGALGGRETGYLLDRFALAISVGIISSSNARAWTGISKTSKALIVATSKVSGLSALPDAENEARGIAAQFEGAHLLLDQASDYDAISSELPRTEIFHFSGHAAINLSSAGMLLAGSRIFDATNLQHLRSGRIRMVTLSACATAQGRSGMFDDEDSLVRQFLRYGSPTVVASRWAVDSRATAELMGEFYKHLLHGSSAPEALGAAAASVRARKGLEHPYYWAGFSVFGIA